MCSLLESIGVKFLVKALRRFSGTQNYACTWKNVSNCSGLPLEAAVFDCKGTKMGWKEQRSETIESN
jgi:hypothetical protein